MSTPRIVLAAALIGGLLATSALTACGNSAEAGGPQTKELRYQGWVGQVTPPELAADLGYLGGVKLKWIGNTISGPQDIQAATTGDIDFGGAFNGAIVKLKASKAPITAVIGYYGSDQDSLLLTALAGATERIGLIATASTTYNEPYNLARRFASLDIVSGGRAGWNIVTTATLDAARNFNLDHLPAHQERYRRAGEFVDVSLKLWDSWDDDAVLADKATGVWGDDGKIYPPAHQGDYYRVAGALNVPRTPQGRPLLVQAGSSSERAQLRRPVRRGGLHRAPDAGRRPGVLRRPETPGRRARPGPGPRQDPAGDRAADRGDRGRGARAGRRAEPADPRPSSRCPAWPSCSAWTSPTCAWTPSCRRTCRTRTRSKGRRAAVRSWSTWPAVSGSPSAR